MIHCETSLSAAVGFLVGCFPTRRLFSVRLAVNGKVLLDFLEYELDDNEDEFKEMVRLGRF